MHLRTISADGSGSAVPLLESPFPLWALGWSPDGTRLLYHLTHGDQATASGLWLITAGSQPEPFRNDRFFYPQAALSPDGRWVAYSSNQSGRYEVYVDSFPTSGRRVQVSTAGGTQPRWRRDQQELYYLSAESRLIAVAANLGAEAKLGVASPLFTIVVPLVYMSWGAPRVRRLWRQVPRRRRARTGPRSPDGDGRNQGDRRPETEPRALDPQSLHRIPSQSIERRSPSRSPSQRSVGFQLATSGSTILRSMNAAQVPATTFWAPLHHPDASAHHGACVCASCSSWVACWRCRHRREAIGWQVRTLGTLWTQPSTAHVDQPAQHTSIDLINLHYRAESSKPRRYYGYRIGWIPSSRRWMAIEAEHVHSKVFAETAHIVPVRGTLRGAAIDISQKVSLIVQDLSMSHGLNFIFGNFVIRHEFGPELGAGRRRAIASVRLGAGPTVPHAESTVGGVTREQYEYGGIGAQVGGSIEFAVWRSVYVLGEYKLTATDARISVDGGEAVIPARSHHVVAGMAVRF